MAYSYVLFYLSTYVTEANIIQPTLNTRALVLENSMSRIQFKILASTTLVDVLPSFLELNS